MLGDQAQPAESDGARNRATSGPRHAAPRKSMLTRLHVPAGKAVALAAMPTAVLMGMGFTPHFAQADEMPKDTFKAGPCVSQTDNSAHTAAKPSAAGSAAKGDKGTGAAKDKSVPGDTGSGTAGSGGTKPTPSASPSPSAQAPGTKGGSPVTSLLPSGTDTAKPQPSASPTPSTPASGSAGSGGSGSSVDPQDPLGLGHLLGGLLGTGKTGPTPSPSPTATQTPKPSPSPTASAPSTSPAPQAPGKPSSGGSGSSGSSTGSASGSSSGSSAGTSSVGRTVEDAGKGAAGAVTRTVKDLTGATGSHESKAGSTGATAASQGPQSYPCPTYDAKAFADAPVEGGIPLLPDDPWTLKSSKLSLHGLQYDGIRRVQTWSGQFKEVLKFTATGVDIDDLWQIVNGPRGSHTWVQARAGSTSTITNGTVTMYTESLSGNLLGLIPITFTPKAPPPLTLPELFFTDVTVIQAGQFGGDLFVPGMHVVPNQP